MISLFIFFFLLCFLLATDTTYEVAVAAFKLPVVISPHSSIEAVGSTSVIELVKSEHLVNNTSSNNIIINNNLQENSESDILLLSSSINTSSSVIINNSASAAEHQQNMTMVHTLRKTYEENHNTSVIIPNAQSRLLNNNSNINPATSPNRYPQLPNDNGTLNSVSPPLSSSPLRYSTLQNITPHSINNNNNNNNNTNNNNNQYNNNNNGYDWNYSSLDLSHKPADSDKICEKNQHIHHQQQHSHSSSNNNNNNDNDIIEQRNIITVNNNHHYADIQQNIVHNHEHIISTGTAAIRNGLMSIYPSYANANIHSTSVGPGTNSTIDKVIADTLEGETCAIDGDEESKYLTLAPASELHLKETVYSNNHHPHHNNNSTSSSDSRSPSGLSHGDFCHDGSFTSLTIPSSNRSGNVYGSSAMQASEHSPNINEGAYESGLHSDR